MRSEEEIKKELQFRIKNSLYINNEIEALINDAYCSALIYVLDYTTEDVINIS